MFDGKLSVIVGTFQLASPMSSEPPPMRVASFTGPPSRPGLVLSPVMIASGCLSECGMVVDMFILRECDA